MAISEVVEASGPQIPLRPALENSSIVPESKPEVPAQTQPTPLLTQPQVQQLTQAQAPPKPTAQSARPASVAHRTSARYKNVDQPVVMPSSILGGSAAGAGGVSGVGFGLGNGIGGLEKIGMQFGSLSLGGDNFDSNPWVWTLPFERASFIKNFVWV